MDTVGRDQKILNLESCESCQVRILCSESVSDFKVSCFKITFKEGSGQTVNMEDKGLTKASAVVVLPIVVCNEQRGQKTTAQQLSSNFYKYWGHTMCLLTVDGSKPFDMQVPQLHTLSNTRARKIVTGKVIRRACPELPIIQNPNSQVQTCEWRS